MMVDQYEKYDVIGSGAFATCSIVRRKTDGRLLVMKTMSTHLGDMTEQQKLDIVNEVKVLADLNHPNIIQYVTSFVDAVSQHIVMEYAAGGSLHTLIKNAKCLFSEDQIWEWFAQITIALKYVHSQHIMHRDIKPQNILLWGHGRRVIKLADFGIAKVLNSSHILTTTLVGTPYYLSPELCEGRDYNIKSDIWALGCVLYELLALKKPFFSQNIPGLVIRISKGDYDELPQESYEYSNALIDLMKIMLQVDMNLRPDTNDLSENTVLKHKIELWKAVQDSVIEVEAEDAKCEADNYVLSKKLSPEPLVESGEMAIGIAHPPHISGSELASPSSRSTHSSGSVERHKHMSRLEKQCIARTDVSDPSFPSISGSPSTKRSVYSTGVQRQKRLGMRTVSGKSMGSHRRSSGTSYCDIRGTTISDYSAISISSLSEIDARVVMSRFVVEASRIYRWGSGQRMPILDERLLGFAIDRIATPRFLEFDAEYVHYLALGEQGEVMSWGSGQDGCLGIKGQTYNGECRQPKILPYFANRAIRISDLDCGSSHCAAVSNNGKVYVWGDMQNAGGIEGLELAYEQVQRRLTELAPFASASVFEGKNESWGDGDSNCSPTERRSTLSRSSASYLSPVERVSNLSSIDSSSRNSGLSTQDPELFNEEEDIGDDSWPEWAKLRSSDLQKSNKSDGNPFGFNTDADNFIPDDEEEDDEAWPDWARANRKPVSPPANENPFASPGNENPFAFPISPPSVNPYGLPIAVPPPTGLSPVRGHIQRGAKRDHAESLCTTGGESSKTSGNARRPSNIVSAFPDFIEEPDEASTASDTMDTVDESPLQINTQEEPLRRTHSFLAKCKTNVKGLLKGIKPGSPRNKTNSIDSEEPSSPRLQSFRNRFFGRKLAKPAKQQESTATLKKCESSPEKTFKFFAESEEGEKLSATFDATTSESRTRQARSATTSGSAQAEQPKTNSPKIQRDHFLASCAAIVATDEDEELAKKKSAPKPEPTAENSADRVVENKIPVNDKHDADRVVKNKIPVNEKHEVAETKDVETKERLLSESFEIKNEAKISIGARVYLVSKQEHNVGTVQFVGLTDFAPGPWVGVKLDFPQGKNNGCVKGKQYFQAAANHGIFVRPQGVCRIDDVPRVLGNHLDFPNRPRSTSEASKKFSYASTLGIVREEEDETKENETKEDETKEDVETKAEDLQRDSLLVDVGTVLFPARFTGVKTLDEVPDILDEPKLVYALRHIFVIEITCGSEFTAVLSRDGQVFTFGENDFGQLGVGDDEPHSRPLRVEVPENHIVKTIAAGSEHMLAIMGDGQLYAWGRGSEGQLGYGVEVYDEPQMHPGKVVDIPSSVCSISAGMEHSAAVTDEGEVFTWGSGEMGQLGHGDTETLQAPQRVDSLGRNGIDIQARSITCGAFTTSILTNTQNVYIWGCSSRTREYIPGDSMPVLLPSLTGASVRTLVCGAFANFAICRHNNNPQGGF